MNKKFERKGISRTFVKTKKIHDELKKEKIIRKMDSGDVEVSLSDYILSTEYDPISITFHFKEDTPKEVIDRIKQKMDEMQW